MWISEVIFSFLVQADAGAQAVQIFDSWASELQPQDFDVFAGPYIQKIIDSVRKTHPDLTIILYISGSGGLLERMAACRPDVVSVDQRVDMADAIKRIGPDFAVQVRPFQEHFRSTRSRKGVVCRFRTDTSWRQSYLL